MIWKDKYWSRGGKCHRSQDLKYVPWWLWITWVEVQMDIGIEGFKDYEVVVLRWGHHTLSSFRILAGIRWRGGLDKTSILSEYSQGDQVSWHLKCKDSGAVTRCPESRTMWDLPQGVGSVGDQKWTRMKGMVKLTSLRVLK